MDFELCPNAREVDDEFKAKVKAMYDQLELTLEELKKWGQVVAKWSEPAKCHHQVVSINFDDMNRQAFLSCKIPRYL